MPKSLGEYRFDDWLQLRPFTHAIKPRPMKDSPTSAKQQYFGSLESARGIAALAVAGFHCGQSRWTQGDLLQDAYDRNHFIWRWLNQLVTVVFNGHAAVIFFFALSGFVLTHSALENSNHTNPWWRQFVWRRFLRIYPAVFAAVSIFVLIYGCTGLALPSLNASHFGIGEVLLNFLLFHTSIDGVMWSLRVEMLALPVVMIGIVFSKHGQQKMLFPLALLLTALYFLKEWRAVAASQFAFTFGAIACMYGRPIAEKLKHGKSAVGCIALLAILSARPILGQSSLWGAIVEAAGSACLVGWLAYTNQHIGRRFLDSQLIRGLGKISYSFYLLHPLALLVFWRSQDEIEYFRALGVPSGVLVIGLTFFSTLIICPIAWFVWRTIEMPIMRIGSASYSGK